MGCVPAKPKKTLKPPLPLPIQPTDSTAQPDSASKLPSTTRRAPQKMSRRGATLNPRRCSVSPVEVDDFWGTMPLSLIIDRLNLYHEEVLREKGNFQECVEFIQFILEDLSEKFENSRFRVIKKSNAKFKGMVGKYGQGVLFVRSLGFREKEDCFKIDDGLTVGNMRHKVKEFELAVKKVRAGDRRVSVIPSL